MPKCKNTDKYTQFTREAYPFADTVASQWSKAPDIAEY